MRDGWLVGRSHGVFRWGGAILLVFSLIVLSGLVHRPNVTPVHWALAIVFVVASTLLVGATNEVAVELATGNVRTRRGLFGIVRTRRFVRPQIDGVFMSIVEDHKNPGTVYYAVGLQAGLGRWAMGFYRDLQRATGFPGLPGD